MRIYIVLLVLVVILAALAGCQGKQDTKAAAAIETNRTMTLVVTPVPPAPTTETLVETMPEPTQEVTPAVVLAPGTGQSGPGPLALGEVYRYNSAGDTIEASVYRYRYLDRYSWWDPNYGKFYPVLPENQTGRFLVIFLSLVNTGRRPQWIPSADSISVYSPTGMNYTHLPYRNASYYNEFENETFGDEYPWVRELGANDRDYQYIRTIGFQGAGGGDFLRPGVSNAIRGYLMYEVPGDLTPENTTVYIWFQNLTVASWNLQAPGKTVNNQLFPDFSVSTPSGPPPLPVRFTDLTGGYPDSWSWDLGDNQTSAMQNPVRLYTEPGSYDVTLTVENRYARNSTTKKGAVEVLGDMPLDTNHSVSFQTTRGGHIADGSYLSFRTTNAPGKISLNGTLHVLPAPSLFSLLFHGSGDGEIEFSDYGFENLSFGNVTLYENGHPVDQGRVDSLYVPWTANFSTALRYELSPSRGPVSLTWDARVVLRDEDYSSFTLEGIGPGKDGNFHVLVRSNKTDIVGNASWYSMPDLIIGPTMTEPPSVVHY